MSRKNFGVAAAVLFSLALAGCQTNKPNALDQAAASEGLVKVQNKVMDAVYKRPEAVLTSYNKLLLRPVEVQFSKDWDPGSSTSALYLMNEPDREKIKSELAQAFADVFKRDLEKAGYPIVTEPGPDVLEIRAAIVNLYINAPDVSMQTAGRTKVYTTDAGEMTLIAQLHDAVTGQLLARAFDRRSGMDTGTWQWSNSVTNSAEARSIIASWANALRRALDASRASQ